MPPPLAALLLLLTAAAEVPTAASQESPYFNYDSYDDYGSTDGFEDYTYREEDCQISPDGKSQLNGSACDLIVSGDDRAILLPGGLTGIFEYTGCQNGRPMYKRQGDKAPLWMIFSNFWGDWDFCNTSEFVNENVYGYGGEGTAEMRPEQVQEHDWYVLKDLTIDSTDTENDFVPAEGLSVKCLHRADDPPSCTDGIQNGQEEGVDCGGPDCMRCISAEEEKANYEALKKKLADELAEQKHAEATASFIATAGIVVIAFFGIAIVCGGPMIILIRKLNSNKGPAYQAVEMLTTGSRKGEHKV